MIYFLQPTDGGPVKIGFTENLDARLAQLQAHYGRPLALLATMEGGREQEAEVHARFAALRLGRTEQFRPASELMAFIGRPLLVGANLDAVEVIPAACPTNLKPVRLDLSATTHRLLRRIAADADKSMASYAREVLEERLQQEAKKRGIKP